MNIQANAVGLKKFVAFVLVHDCFANTPTYKTATFHLTNLKRNLDEHFLVTIHILVRHKIYPRQPNPYFLRLYNKPSYQ